MSPVKFIHVLDRVKAIDNEIAEVRQMQNTLSKSRSYTERLHISMEQEVNNLLNERVKLMEFRIENPPEFFTKTAPAAGAFLFNRPRHKLEDLSTTNYQSSADFTYKPLAKTPDKASHTNEDDAGIRTSLRNEANRMNLKEIFKDRQETAKELKPRSNADRLKDIRPLEI